jgi:hypothetical protein
MKSLKLFLCEKSLEGKMDHPRDCIVEKGMYEPGAWRVSDHKEEETLIILVNC